MKKIIFVVFVVYLSVGVIYSLSGGYYKEKLDRRMSVSTVHGEVKSVTNAFVDQEKLLNICVEGNFIGLKESEGPFLMKTPIDEVGDNDAVSKKVIGFGDWYSEVKVDGPEIQSCSATGGENEISVRRIEVNYHDIFSGSNFIPDTFSKISEEVVYELTVIDSGQVLSGKSIAFVRDYRGERQVIFIKLKGKKVEGSKMLALMMPLAIVTDAITYPIQIYGLFNLKH